MWHSLNFNSFQSWFIFYHFNESEKNRVKVKTPKFPQFHAIPTTYYNDYYTIWKQLNPQIIKLYNRKIKTKATKCAKFKDMACKYSCFRITYMEYFRHGPWNSGPRETKTKIRREKNERFKQNELEFHCKL